MARQLYFRFGGQNKNWEPKPKGCPKCGERDQGKFGKRSDRRSGLQSYCKQCMSHAAQKNAKKRKAKRWEEKIAAAQTEQGKWEMVLKSEGLALHKGNHEWLEYSIDSFDNPAKNGRLADRAVNAK